MLEKLEEKILIEITNYLKEREVICLTLVSKEINQKLDENIEAIWRWRCIKRWEELSLATQIHSKEWKQTFLRKGNFSEIFESIFNEQLNN